ncbi:cytochrome b/b6 domain-containing protein [Thiospirillum jenense]|uniref:Cytochrome b/b6 domain-containing protein n=1 Tax=Thiospirillum jenense TaxID=1653858 RepID=A0A839HGZ4_9GAMM|nr:cytochrome b/b6 domain-containing protein [Thiospirillum jenense]MBB1126149.1 cytochrome b/b6 domain-containing protein [Thiospirillum jenense]
MSTTELHSPIDKSPLPPFSKGGKLVRIWDPLVRVFHWSLVAAFAIAYIVEDDLLTVHVWAGYTIITLLAVRIVWGLIGTRHARFTDFIYRPPQVITYLTATLAHRAPRYLGHNPAGGAMVIVMLLALLATTFSGLALYGAAEFAGPLADLMRGMPESGGEILEEVHEFCANFTVFLIALHLAGVAFSSLMHRENLVAAMISGNKRSADE